MLHVLHFLMKNIGNPAIMHVIKGKFCVLNCASFPLFMLARLSQGTLGKFRLPIPYCRPTLLSEAALVTSIEEYFVNATQRSESAY